MGKNTSISLSNHFEEFVIRSIKSGRYKNVSEVIRAGLRLLEEEENKLEMLRKALKEGEQSGYLENYDVEEHLNELKARYYK